MYVMYAKTKPRMLAPIPEAFQDTSASISLNGVPDIFSLQNVMVILCAIGFIIRESIIIRLSAWPVNIIRCSFNGRGSASAN